MGSDVHHTVCKIKCVLCEKSDENDVTGALSSKGNISAHQNCLLYSSGLYCKNSPIYDDLFGFDVEDVKKEVRRGKKLTCHHCERRGATVGCDVKRCKRSYHYPCAIEANGKATENTEKGTYTLFCEMHDPQTSRTNSVNSPSTSGLNTFKRCHGQVPHRSESNSSTGSSELGLASGKKSRSPVVFFDKDDENQAFIDPIFAPVESDADITPPTQPSVVSVSENARVLLRQWRPCEKLNASSTASVCGASTSGLNQSKSNESTSSPGQLNDRDTEHTHVESDMSPEMETPRRKKRRISVLLSDDEELVTVAYPSVPQTPVPHRHSTPVTENTRPCEEVNPLTTDDGDDTDIDSDVSQSLLTPEPYNVTVPCVVLIDSGPLESENSVEPCSPSNAALADACLTPESVTAPEPEETGSINITAHEPQATTFGSALPGSSDPKPHQELLSAVQPLSTSPVIADQPAELPPAEDVSSSPDRSAEKKSCSINVTSSVRSRATMFWASCGLEDAELPPAEDVSSSPDRPAAQPESPDRSSPTSELPAAALPSAVQPLSTSPVIADQSAELPPAEDVSSSPDRSAEKKSCSINVTASVRSRATTFWASCGLEDAERPPAKDVSSSPDRPAEKKGCSFDVTTSVQPRAATFWARCNEAGCTEEIFSELMSQLKSLGERINSQEASHQDFEVALKVLKASGRLPTIITHLEQDLEKQEKELKRKKAALKDASAVLGIHSQHNIL